MNPLHWLEQHPNAALVAVVAGSVTLLAIAAWCVHWYVVAVRYWLDWLPRRDPGFGDDWQAEPWTVDDALEMTAVWRLDLPGPVGAEQPEAGRGANPQPARAGELHRNDLPGPGYNRAIDLLGGHHYLGEERMVTRDVWDAWWDSLDGLEREVMRCRWAREHEARLHAELLAETRELCAA